MKKQYFLGRLNLSASIKPATKGYSVHAHKNIVHDSEFFKAAFFSLKGGGGFYSPLEAPLYPHQNTQQDELECLAGDMYAAFLSYTPGDMVYDAQRSGTVGTAKPSR